MNNESGQVTFTYSGVIVRNKRNVVCVRFERKNGSHVDYAEGTIPDPVLDKVEGFSAEEIQNLLDYLREHSTEIISNAKELNHIKNWFR